MGTDLLSAQTDSGCKYSPSVVLLLWALRAVSALLEDHSWCFCSPSGLKWLTTYCLGSEWPCLVSLWEGMDKYWGCALNNFHLCHVPWGSISNIFLDSEVALQMKLWCPEKYLQKRQSKGLLTLTQSSCLKLRSKIQMGIWCFFEPRCSWN